MNENEANSVMLLVGQLRASDDEAVTRLWQDYFQKLVALARTMLQGAFRRSADEEDIALSAFASFCRGVEAGRFPEIDDRDNLWRSLFALVARKSARLKRDLTRLKRDDRRTIDEAGLIGGPDGEMNLSDFVSKGPTPEFVAEVAEECERLLLRLDNDELRKLAIMKMEGYTSEEIADELSVAPRTIERRLRLIRTIWMESSES